MRAVGGGHQVDGAVDAEHHEGVGAAHQDPLTAPRRAAWRTHRHTDCASICTISAEVSAALWAGRHLMMCPRLEANASERRDLSRSA